MHKTVFLLLALAAAGGDILTWFPAKRPGDAHGREFVVENRPGAPLGFGANGD
jgi:hypothetical protein